ncbi:MAG: hypothetical protein V4683_17895, partial [Bacteroidota bacterium]
MKNYYQQLFSTNPILNWADRKKLLFTPLLLLIQLFYVFDSFGQCTPNTLAFAGSQPVFNSACGNLSYQNVTGSDPDGDGQTYVWEYSLNGAAFVTINVTSKDLSKTEITDLILTPNALLTGSYEIRRTVTDIDPDPCSSSTSIFLYYSQNSGQTTGGIASPASLSLCSPAVGTIEVNGNTGPVLRWESSTDGGMTWTPIANTTNTIEYNIINNTNNPITTCYRALIDDICEGSIGSVDIDDDYSTQSCITVSLGAPDTPGEITGDAIVCPGSVSNYSVVPVANATSYTWTVPAGWTIESGQGTNSIEVTASSTCGDAGNITVTASSSCATSDPSSLAISAVDETDPIPPSAPSAASYQCIGDVPAPGDLTATDNCSDDITVTGVDQTDSSNPCNVIITRTWTFTDDCGNSSSTSQTITVIDDTDPVAPQAPSAASYQCIGDVPAPGDLTATDNCSPDITV